MKKATFVLTLLLVLAISAFPKTQLINYAVCNGTLIVAVNSPQNRTYTSNSVTVSISASDPEARIGPESISYSLDGAPPVVITEVPVGIHSLNGSTVLSLPDGTHNIVGIGTTWFGGADGIFTSAPVYFTVNSDSTPSPSPTTSQTPSPSTTPTSTPSPSEQPTETPGFQPNPFPTTTVAAAVAAVAIAGAGLLIYFKKRKR
jgi:hypothetical protein